MKFKKLNPVNTAIGIKGRAMIDVEHDHIMIYKGNLQRKLIRSFYEQRKLSRHLQNKRKNSFVSTKVFGNTKTLREGFLDYKGLLSKAA